MFGALTFTGHHYNHRSLRLRRRAWLCLEELEDRAVPATAVDPTSSAAVAQNTQTNQSLNTQNQVVLLQGTPIGALATVPPTTTTSSGPAIMTGNTGALPQNGLNPGDQIAVFTGNVGSLPPDGSDTTQTGSQVNLLGITPVELIDLTGPTPNTNEDVAQYLQAVARPGTLSFLRLSLLTVERPGGVGSNIGQNAIGGQPIDNGQGEPLPQQQQQPQPQGGQAVPQAFLDIPAPNLLAILQAPPPNQPALVEEKVDNTPPPRVEEPPAPTVELLPVRKSAEANPLLDPALKGVWDAYFSEEGRGMDLTRFVKMPAENHYEEFSLPWYPPALGFALFLGGWSGFSLENQPRMTKRRMALPRLPVKE